MSLCPKITNVGIQALFAPANPDEFGCFELVHLDVSATSVTMESLGLILSKIPKLRKLCLSDLSGESQLELTALPRLNIQHFDSHGTFMDGSALKLLIESCPKLTELRMNWSSGLGNVVANHLTALSHLTLLDLSGACEGILFGDIEKFLKSCGSHLESLNLSGVHNVYVSVLCLNCSSLTQLTLAHCQNVCAKLPALNDHGDSLPQRRNRNRLSYFCPRLSSINLDFVTFRDSSQPEFNQIITNILCDHPNLEKLSLKNTDIDDEVLRNVCESSSSFALRILNLSNCNAITIEAVRCIVDKCRSLQTIDLSHCKQLVLASVTQMRQNLKATRSPLQIVWV